MGGKISIDEAPAWVRRLEGRLRTAAEKGLLSAAHRLVGVIQETIDREPRKPVDRGIYRAGWAVRRVAHGVLVYNATPAASLIEYGVRAENVKIGRKMIDALAEWVLRKGLVGGRGQKRDAGGRFLNAGERAVEARRIAWAIAQSMKKNGIFNRGKGLRILEKARARGFDLIAQEVVGEIRKMRRSAD